MDLPSASENLVGEETEFRSSETTLPGCHTWRGNSTGEVGLQGGPHGWMSCAWSPWSGAEGHAESPVTASRTQALTLPRHGGLVHVEPPLSWPSRGPGDHPGEQWPGRLRAGQQSRGEEEDAGLQRKEAARTKAWAGSGCVGREGVKQGGGEDPAML